MLRRLSIGYMYSIEYLSLDITIKYSLIIMQFLFYEKFSAERLPDGGVVI